MTLLITFHLLTSLYLFIIIYRGFHEKGIFSVHSFNDDYLSIPKRPGSSKYLFHEIPVTTAGKPTTTSVIAATTGIRN